MRQILDVLLVIVLCHVISCSNPHEPDIDTKPPTVKSVIPADGSQNVSKDSKVKVVFSENILATSANTNSFLVWLAANQVAGTVNGKGDSAVFTPSSDFIFGMTYQAKITTDIEDKAGNNLAQEFAWSFTIESNPAVVDTIPPVVIESFPAGEATNVPINTSIWDRFSEIMDPSKFTVNSYKLTRYDTLVPTTISYDGVTATLTPNEPLEYETEYVVELTEALQDTSGNSLVPVLRKFTTKIDPADTTRPRVVASMPLDQAVDVSVNTPIWDDFSEIMDPSTFTAESYKLTRNDTLVPTTISYSGVRASLTFNQALMFATEYKVTLSGTLTDLAGNSLIEVVRVFTTEVDPNPPDTTKPIITFSFPVQGALDVSVDVVISDDFSEPMDPSTFTEQSYKLTCDGIFIPCAVGFSGLTATLTPNDPLAFATEYVVTLTSALTDTAGNSLNEQSRSFTTEAEPQIPWTIPQTLNRYKFSSLDIDQSGNVFFTGSVYLYELGRQKTDFFTGMFDNQGILQWKELMLTDVYDIGKGLVIDENYSYSLRSIETYGTGAGDVFVDKREAMTGDSVWSQFITGSLTAAYGIAQYGSYIYAATSDGIFQVSKIDGSVIHDVDPGQNFSIAANNQGVFVVGGSPAIFLKCYDHNLNLQWIRTYDTNITDIGSSVALTDNHIYVSGTTDDVMNGVLPELVLQKYDYAGSVVWDSTYIGIQPPGNPFRRNIAIDPAENVYLVGGPVKFSPQGEKLWENSIEGFFIKERSGILYVTDYKKNYLQLFDATDGSSL